ncbi:unnamed protein product [Sphagnum troendelagicum]
MLRSVTTHGRSCAGCQTLVERQQCRAMPLSRSYSLVRQVEWQNPREGVRRKTDPHLAYEIHGWNIDRCVDDQRARDISVALLKDVIVAFVGVQRIHAQE